MLTACGIETRNAEAVAEKAAAAVATVLTACGIETRGWPSNQPDWLK